MGRVKVIYRYFTWLSIDVALGATCMQCFIGRIQSFEVPWSGTVSLFTAIWCIYLYDHYKDTQNPRIISARRLFHKSRKNLIKSLLAINLMVGLVSFLFLPLEVKVLGLLLTSGCLLYFLTLRYVGAFKVKELIVAFFYALGVFLIFLPNENVLLNLYMAGQLFLLAFVNLLVFSIFEHKVDLAEAFDSLPTIIGEAKARHLTFLLSGVLFSSVFLSIWLKLVPPAFEFFIFFAWLILVILLMKRTFFSKNDRYRLVGDAIFFIPIFLLW